ncbi:MAG: glutamate--tRNA ligase [Pseudomonadota bacterium]
MTVRTRFAPSPTGFLHVGGARTALFCYLFARRHGGEFVLRIEDTDRERSTQESVDAILHGMDWLGLEYDEGPVFQTHRFDRYAEVLHDMLARDLAYRCYCSRERLDALREEQRAAGLKPRYDGRCAAGMAAVPAGVDPVIRFRNPGTGSVSFDDAVRGTVTIANSELDDLIIARGDGTPTYNFTVVIDDIDMQITHVVRGDDHVNNTPRQINIMRALDAETPVFAHLPMILGGDGQRLSKRHGAVSVLQFREDGYLPQALLNYLVRLGWSHGDQEIFSLSDMVELFSLDGVNRAAAAFDYDKLGWLNQHYLKDVSPNAVAPAFATQLADANVPVGERSSDLPAIIEAQRERSQTLKDMALQSAFYFQDPDKFDEAAAKKHLRPVAAGPLSNLRDRLIGLDTWEQGALQSAVDATVVELDIKLGKLAQPLRVALSGRAATPSIDVTLSLVGRDATLRRIERALSYISARASQS